MTDMSDVGDVGDEAFIDPYEADWDDEQVGIAHSEFQRLLNDTASDETAGFDEGVIKEEEA